MNPDFTMVYNGYMPLREYVFTTLRQAILKGELAPGERLMELQLAEKMGVSRTPIREAIRKLEKEGLVVMIPRKGAEVAGISEKVLKDVLQVRSTLETLAYTLAYENITTEEIARLRGMEDQFEKAIEGGDLVEMTTTDESFHFVIYDAARNDKLREILDTLKENMYRYRMEYLKDESYRPELVAEHQAIIASFVNRDKVDGIAVCERHIENQQNAVINKLKQEQEEKKAMIEEVRARERETESRLIGRKDD